MATIDVPDNSYQGYQQEDACNGECAEFQIGSITFVLKKGDLAKEKVDVIVNSTSGNLNLSSGSGSRALVCVAGDSLQVECHKNYPQGIQEGEVAETAGGNLDCTFVFHCFLRAWDSSDVTKVRKVFCKSVFTCLKKADKYGFASIAFPALGSGFLDFPASEILHLMIKCVTEISKTNSTLHDVRLVVYSKDVNLFQDFLYEMKTMSQTQTASSTSSSVTTAKPSCDGIAKRLLIKNFTVRVKQGSLVEQKTDVIVNITNSQLNLSEGSLSKALLAAAGPEIQQECYENFIEGLQLGQIAITRGYNLHCRSVYHSTLPVYEKTESENHKKILYFLVQQCLMQVNESGLKSIAIPVVGIGHQRFPYNVAAHTIVESIAEYCVNNDKSSLTEISLVVFTGGSSKNDWKLVWEAVCNELRRWKRKLVTPADNVNNHTKDAETLLAEQLPEHEIHHAKDTSLSEQVAPPSRGTKEWFKMKYEEELRTPPYWTHFKGGHLVQKLRTSMTLDSRTKSNYVLRDVDKEMKDAIVKLVYRTWEADKVGHGKDARGLDQLCFTKIRVTEVQRVENLDIFEDYAADRKKKFCKAWKKRKALTALEDLSNSSGCVRTISVGDAVLMTDIHREINEYYLFHGTKEETVEKVLNQGLDSRMAGDNAMFGLGVYAAESSTKADQYVDSKDRRTSAPKKMFLVRMCLGEICVCSNPVKYRKAPCRQCLKDNCDHKNFSDSVVGDGQWIFREFVTYKPCQSYPEYLITYIRE